WPATGTYYYGVQYRKKSTQALSNVVLDVKASVTDTTGVQTISLSGLTNLDSTLYDRIVLWRSAFNGASLFTTGDIVAEIDPSSSSYNSKFVDGGDSIYDSQNTPRPGNVILDNNVLPTGTYNTLALWKRRAVVASGSTVYISDLDKPESWPLTNTIPVPSGGAITALAIVSFSPNAQSTDEFLCVFKEAELWVISGSSYTDWILKFVDASGTIAQPLVVTAGGHLVYIDNRGIYLWDGLSKPIYLSRPIEQLWSVDGKLDLAKLSLGSGQFLRDKNQIVWFLSHLDYGEQVYILKLDLKLTLQQITPMMNQRVIDGIFLQGIVNNPVYASAAFIFPTSASQEYVVLSGDNAGYTYRQFYATTGIGPNDYTWSYVTKDFDMQKLGAYKQFFQVIAWVENVGNWPLYLDYWTDFRLDDSEASTNFQTITTANQSDDALWDIAFWDVAKWDDFHPHPKRLIFNLAATPYNNNQGETIKLRFRNSNSEQPVLLYGFSIVYADLGMRT